MRSWAAEHGPSYEVPALIDFMVDKEIMRDVSWHNDTMPRFQIPDPKSKDESRGVTIWVDHPIGSMRETGPGGKRFLVQFGDFMSNTEYDKETDDLEEAVRIALGHAAGMFKKAGHWRIPNCDGIVMEWMKSLEKKY